MNFTFTNKSVFPISFLLIFIFPFSSFSQNLSTSMVDQNKLDVAIQHLERNHLDLKLTNKDISNYRISDQYESKHNGVTHIYLQQQHQGIDVQNAIININVLKNNEILNMGNRFVGNLSERINTTIPTIEPIDGLKKVINKFNSLDGINLELKERKNSQHYIYKNEGIALEPLSVRLKYELQQNQSVRLVWQVEFQELDGQHVWRVQVDAVSGEILDYYDAVLHCNFSHNGDVCGEVHDPIFHKKNNNLSSEKISNTKVGVPFKNNASPFMANTYNVFPIPIESPNHGSRAMITNPSDTTASPFGWHDVDGVDGADYTITRGNNVHAYNDIFSQNSSIGGEPDGGAMLEFDFPFANSNDTIYQQIDAAIVNLFYWNNVTHDLWYQYGLDEVSGNFQANNYGNGGIENDHVRAEAIDGSGSNNANFFTPDDGQRPRMQMFIWGANNLPSQPNRLYVTDSAGVMEDYLMMPAGFGAELPTTPIVGEIVQVDDGIGNIHDACENVGNIPQLAGKIALIDRGETGCQFGTQVLRAQYAGAIAAIVCNNDSTNMNRIFSMNGGDDGSLVTIPAVMVSVNTCAELKIDPSIFTIELVAPDYTLPDPSPQGIDSDFDNGVIIHEYTHGISNRLTGGPSASNCLRNMEQAGEGWSDWFALVMLTTSNDNANEGRGIGTYVSGEGPNGEGIREYRYTRDMMENPHTYADINSVAVPHGVGSIWAVTIWDLYWNMVDVYGFDDDLYNGTGGNNLTMQLVLDGLKLQPCSPTFIDSRDAILAADMANNNGENQCLIWETFARRGIGYTAVDGGVARFDVPLDCQFILKIAKTASAEVMAGEVLTYTIEVKNDSPDMLTNITITDMIPDGVELVNGSVSCSNFTFDNSLLTISLGDMATGDVITCTYDVLVADTPFSYLVFEDGVENGLGNWTVTTDVGTDLWEVSSNSHEGANAWFASNPAGESDQRLTTASAYEITGANARLSFWHYINSESERDGGNVEISIDGGATWDDLRNDFIQNGYNGFLNNSILNNQLGFTGDRSRYIQSIVDLSDFQGEEVMFRWRFSSNELGGGEGWYIDEVKIFGDFHSITNEACVSSDLNENFCSDFTTTVFGDGSTPIDNVDSDLDISIFPNPTKGKVFVKIQNTSLIFNNASTFIKTLSIDGRILQTKTIETISGTFEIDFSELPKGIYFLQIQNENSLVVEKVVVQ